MGMLILYGILGYFLAGSIFAVIFLTRWIHKIDEGVAESPWTFKLIIAPGCIVLWPVLLRKYISETSNKHP